MNDTVNEHAFRYATEKGKLFLIDLYKTRFPHYFDTVSLQTRPATSQDYYVPSSLKSECIVVEPLAFDETSCRRFSCYGFKKDWEPCTDADLPHWISMGSRFELACAPSCRDHEINAEWVRGSCVVANPLKKLIAAKPEMLFESEAHNLYHGGIDVDEGTLRLNARYCEAYGLDFEDGDCYASGGQSFGEFLLGRTTIRAVKTAHLRPYSANPPPLPAYLNYVHPTTAVPGQKRRRLKRSAKDEAEQDRLIKEIAVEMAKDAARELGEAAIETLLKKKIPHFLNATVDRLAAKLVIKQSMASTLKTVGTGLFRGLGKGFGYATVVLGLYDITIGVLDTLDTFHYNKVLNRSDLEEFDRLLDIRYFQDGPKRPALNPEYVWNYNVLLEEEESAGLFAFMAERVSEYWAALKAHPPTRRMSPPVWKRDVEKWEKYAFTVWAFMAIVVVLVSVEWIHFWATTVFFLKVFLHI